MKKKCLITGGAGMIGLTTAKLLLEKGFNVHIFDLAEQIVKVNKKIPKEIQIHQGSILDYKALKQSMKKCEIVFHFAAMLGVANTESDKYSCLNINAHGTNNALKAAAANKVDRFIFASSSEVYGEPLKNPIDETHITQGKTIYGITKLMGEQYCLAYKQKYGLNYTILRFFNTYGPGQKNNFAITKFISLAKQGRKITINGNGNQLRSYMYVTDAAEAATKACTSKKAKNKILNIGNGTENITLVKLVQLISKTVGSKKKFILDKEFKNADRSANREIFKRYCSSKKAQNLLNWKPKVKLTNGIALTSEEIN
jgi:nucleoside-diphosphate-sugar epimerase